ncbi:MAG: HAD hydrolase-like protein [Enterocloster clostridioformis]
MFEAAAQRFEIDKPHSFMIGDKLLDVVAGNSLRSHHHFGGNRLW